MMGSPRTQRLPVTPDAIFTLKNRTDPPQRWLYFVEADRSTTNHQRYRKKLERAHNLRTYLNANVLGFELAPGSEAVEAVRIGRLSPDSKPIGRRPLRLTARLFVLCAGGIENARLLLASRSDRPAGLGNQNDLVGRYFMEHPVVSGRLLPSRRGTQLALYLWHRKPKATLLGGLCLPRDVMAREQMLNVAFWLHTRKMDEFERSLYHSARELDAADSETPEAVAEPPGYSLQSIVEQAPNPDSRVLLAEEVDALGMPRVRLDWRLGALESHSLRRAYEWLGRELGRTGIGRVSFSLPEGDAWSELIEWGFHHMGTTRMHSDPRRGVVDPDCRVHGVPNLYVAGSSVFPTSGAANPTLTIVALALRLADHLRKELS